MTTIDQISQVLADHTNNAIDEAEALRRVRQVTGAPERLRILIDRTRSQVERYGLEVRHRVESIRHAAERIAADLDASGPEAVSAVWISLHAQGLVEAQAKLADARGALRELERLVED
jgi:hypothetical protein